METETQRLSKIGARPQFKRKVQNDFHTVVKNRVNEWFAKEGISPHSNASMKIKTALHLMTYFFLWGLLLSDRFNGIPLLLLFALFGMIQGLMGFNISHDALHGAYSSSPKVNRLLGYFFDWNGESSLVWRKSHNVLHHTYTNITGHDGDIDKATLVRFSPHDPWRPHNRYQHIYTPLLYSLISFPWIFWGDWKWLIDSAKEGQVKGSEAVIFSLFKFTNYFLINALPFIALSVPVAEIILGIIIMHMAGSFLISLIFQLAHLVEGVEFPLPNNEGVIESEWAAHEMKTTSNFATQNRALSWILGGLNFQIEHHLFPHVCHVHYPAISSIVKITAEEFGLPYNEKPTLMAAVVSHFRILKKFGAAPQRSYACVLRTK